MIATNEAARTAGVPMVYCALCTGPRLTGGIVGHWHKNGTLLRDTELDDLAAHDGEAFLQFGSVRFRLTVETVVSRLRRGVARAGAAVVLTLRQVDGPQPSGPIHLVEFVETSPLADTVACEGRQCGRLDNARRIADRTARRYVCGELLRKAQDMVGDRAA